MQTTQADAPVGNGFNFDVSHSVEGMKRSILNHMRYTFAHHPATAPVSDWTNATSLAIRDRILDQAARSRDMHREQNVRRVYYLSLEYLMGRLLENNLRNTDTWEIAKEALKELGQDIDEIVNAEPDMGLGNGGLGRLAACFLDSMATLNLPAVGYGIFYEFGLFRQQFKDYNQVENPDAWNRFGNPWEIVRPQYSVEVHVYGNVETEMDENGKPRAKWVNTRKILGVPRDIPIAGYECSTVNYLRLWESRSSEEFNLQIFNQGDYVDAVRDKVEGENISKVLYPNDATARGRELRLVQEYFFVTCSIRDIIRRHKRDGNDWDNFSDKVAMQLNDTHPAVAIAELMRIFIDEEGMEFEKAMEICQRTFAYTNHTLLPEALEKWSVPLFEYVLPRHLQIIYMINDWFLENVVEKKWPGDTAMKATLSIVEESNPKQIRMAYLSVIASHTTNGVAALHTQLLKERLFPEFFELFPDRFQNKTNGITPRRWLKVCNPELSALFDETIGSDWVTDLDRLQKVADYADDSSFQEKFMAIKHRNKELLCDVIADRCGVTVDPSAMFDVQIKRLHEYKRQHLNLLHILTLYRRLLDNPGLDIAPRAFIFGAKAAPGYYLAKQIIHCINAVADKINNDESIGGKLKVAFLPNYGVTLAERIIPASDLSEQISTAGKEASGTGNMKLALNGSLTIGTLDGANVEIKEEVGDENIFIFGLTAEEALDLVSKGYNPHHFYSKNDELRTVIDWLDSGFFTHDRNASGAVKRSLLEGGDPFLVLADYAAYVDCQAEVDANFRNKSDWAKKAIINSARVGKFSSDRTIREYADEIWKLPSIKVPCE